MTFTSERNLKDSGIDWIGYIPQSWQVGKFRHIFTESKEINGKNPVGEMLSVSGYRGVELKEYSSDSLKRDQEDLETYRVVRPGQLAVNTMWLNYAGLGVSGLTGHVSPAYRSYWIDPKLDPRFAHHLMRSQIYVNAYTGYLTGVRPNSLQMSRENLMNWPVLIPEMKEQIAIASFLDRETSQIDELIEKQQQLIETLEERRKAFITRAVTRGLDPDVPKKNSGNSWIGDIPHNWEMKRLKDVAVVQASNVDKKSYEGDEKVLLCNYVDVYYNDKITLDLKFMEATATKAEIRKFSLRADTVLITKDSESANDIGIPAYVEDDLPGVVCGYHLSIIEPKAETSGHFLKWYFDSSSTRGIMETHSNGLTRMALGQGAITSLPIATPDLKEQLAIADFIDGATSAIDELVEKSRTMIIVLTERRQALISAAVTGKIDVRGK